MIILSKKLITTYAGLQDHLNKITKLVTLDIAIDVQELLKNKLMDEVYLGQALRKRKKSGYGSGSYERTFQLVESITFSVESQWSNRYTAKVYFDYSDIQPENQREWRDGDGFNAHMSLPPKGSGFRSTIAGDISYNGKSIGEWLVEWVEGGQNSSVYSYEGTDFFKETEEKLGDSSTGSPSKYLVNIAKKLYRQYGCTISR